MTIRELSDEDLSRWIAETDPETFARRFMSKVTKIDTGCWMWSGHRTGYDYGEFYLSKNYNFKPVRAHRVAYIWFVGPIPNGLMPDHTCRERACVNPAHIELVTNKINVLRGVGPTAINAQKESCPQGHEYTAENTYTRLGKRYCRQCVRVNRREGMRRSRQRKKESNANR